MSNPSKAKGTGGETELLRILEEVTGRKFRRTEAGWAWDVETVNADESYPPIRILATRPDRGQWLLSMPIEDWASEWDFHPIHVEVKRYRRFALHTIWEGKFGR